MLLTGALAGGPVGLGYAVGALIATQGAGQLHDMALEQWGMEPLQ